MSIFSGLAELQAHDVALAQLHHRRGHLPEHADRAAQVSAIERLTTDSAPVRQQHTVLATKMNALESSVHELDEKISHVEATMFSGTITSPRELQGFEADIASLKKRRSELEDEELALIDQMEPFDEQLGVTDAKISAANAEIERLDIAIIAAQAEIDVQAAQHISERAALAATIDGQTLALYEQIRAKNRGIGAALLEHGTCMACKIKLAAIELDRIMHLPAETLVRCEECSVILIRP